MRGKRRHTSIRRGILHVALGTAFILLIPLTAMQFTDEIKWELPDFIIIGILLFSAGVTYELIARETRTRKSRIVTGVVIVLAVLYIWAELAVGIFTDLGS